MLKGLLKIENGKESYLIRVSLIFVLVGLVFAFVIYIETKWQIHIQTKETKTFFDVTYLARANYVVPQSRFRFVGHACGGPESVTSFQSLGGIYLYRTLSGYSSSVQADIALREKLKSATSILEYGAKCDKRRNKVGQRVVAVFTNKRRQQISSVLWTYHSRLTTINSFSLQEALTFEKELLYLNH